MNPNGLSLKLYIQPRASKNEISGIYAEEALKIRLTSPPVEGAANSACINFLADILHMRKDKIEITAGRNARLKHITLKDIPLDKAASILLSYLPD